MIQYIIVDDEPLAHKLIEGYCDLLPHLKLKQNCYSALEALEFLNNQTVDIMFLDLNMPKLKGFDFLRTLSSPPKVIVTTAYKNFALEGYDLNVADYLLKPFSFERLVKAINKAVGPQINNSTTISLVKRPKEEEFFFIKGDKKYHQIRINDILYVEAYSNYTKLHLHGKMLVCHEKISNFNKILPSNNFLRVHKSFIVALNKISLIEGNRISIEDAKIPIGQTYKNEVNKLYN